MPDIAIYIMPTCTWNMNVCEAYVMYGCCIPGIPGIGITTIIYLKSN